MSETTTRRPGYRSLFWPVLLIGAGVVLLLGNLGVISAANIISLLRLWPLLLILIGVDLLFGRTSPLVGGLIGVAAVVLAVVIMLIGPSIGLAGDWEVREFSDVVSARGVESARVSLDLSVGRTTVSPVSDRANLMEADLRYVGPDIAFEASGESTRTVRLGQEEGAISTDFGGLFNWLISPEEELRWEIGLNPDVPIELDINGGVGDANLNLGEFKLSALNLNGGVGGIALTLPATESRYVVRINGGVGGVDIEIPDRNADLILRISGGVGSIDIDVPDDAAVRIESTGGLGSVNVPGDFERVSGGEDWNNNEGTWETPGFADAEQRIVLEYNGGVGGLTIR